MRQTMTGLLTNPSLDALLILGANSASELTQLLKAADITQANGRGYSVTAVRKDLDGVPKVRVAGYTINLAALDRIKHLATRAVAENTTLRKLAAARLTILIRESNRYYYTTSHARMAALALLADDGGKFGKYYGQYIQGQAGRFGYYYDDPALLEGLFGIDNPSFWNWRHSLIRNQYLTHLAFHPKLLTGATGDTALDLLATHDLLDVEEYRRPELAGILLAHRMVRHPQVRDKHFDLDQFACLLQREGEPDLEALVQRHHTDADRQDFIDIVFQLYLYARGKLDRRQLLERTATNYPSDHPLAKDALRFYALFLGNEQLGEEQLAASLGENYSVLPLEILVVCWVCGWCGLRLPEDIVDEAVALVALDDYAHLTWPVGELRYALATLLPTHPDADYWRTTSAAWAEQHGLSYLLDLHPLRPRWDAALRAVERLTVFSGADAGTNQPEAEQEPPLRTIWIVELDSGEVYPKEQKMGKRGYTKGRRLKWEELFSPRYRQYREASDLEAVHALQHTDGRPVRIDGYLNEDYIRVDFARMLYEIADHPRIYLGERERVPLEIGREKVRVQVEDRGETLRLRFDPPVTAPGNYQIKKVTPTRYLAYSLSDRQLALARSVGYGIDVPAAARDRLEATLEGMRGDVAVQSDTDLLNSDLPVVEGSDRLSIHLLPLGEGYRVMWLARPLPDLPLYFPPGQGMKRCLAAGEDGRRILERDPSAEEANAKTLLADCPTLDASPNWEWLLDDQQQALRFLLELRRLVTDGRVDVEYPKGQKLRLDGATGFDDLELRVGKQRDWFEVSGALKVNEERVLDLQLLLEQLRDNATGFVKLGEDEFVAVTDELRERIQRMEGLLHERGKRLQLPTLAAQEFAEVAEGLDDIEFDVEWEEALRRIESARHLRPRPPENFHATLRPYQREGYDWMMRLAAWGVGACLADDMGLGKTVQALAVMTARAPEGPALVLAPASVIRNWVAECKRFAPALTPVLLASSKDTHLTEQLGPGDVLMISYGLLTYVEEAIGSVEYATIVADEAQAIKNAETKRARIVTSLVGDFKIATTGTPIENHLGELWSLFRFLNPGLLSSKKAFAEKYALPIANDDTARREQLRRLVQPFILRRRKSEVLKELPAKTEIIITVQPGPEEASLYEAMRRAAIKEIQEAPPEKKKFIVLSQLTRLRQAACHPRLVRPKSKASSAKLELVGETIRELLDGSHKALVFSQFVKHLKIVEGWVASQAIPYQYLDGSTPGRERERRVNAFQAGEGELFLISLKAGGTGLNLTEADYVLHLDPWWNPAAEDQASDRAHRIGQQRPVTVYRFVTEGTIEEQVIALHEDKRDLADQILAGTGKAGKLEVDQVLEMLRAE